MAEIKYEVVQKLAVLSQRPRGWERQLNLISWNDGEPKYDIRDWSPDGTPAACYQKNAEDYLQGDVSTSVMAQYGQQLFGTAQHTHSAHPAPDEDESGVEALVEWREDAPYG